MSIEVYSGRRLVMLGGMVAGALLLASALPTVASGPQLMAQAQTGTPAAPPTVPPQVVAPAPSKPGKTGRLDKKACRAELAALCATTPGSRTKCLTANQAKLGPTCAAALAVTLQTRAQAREVAKAACVADAQKFCGTARGAARTQCLEVNKAQLSPECLARIEKKNVKEARQKAAAQPKQ